MYDLRRKELEDGMASSASEWNQADARQLGETNPDRAWVLTDRDTWVANPHYVGAPVPHPEMDWED